MVGAVLMCAWSGKDFLLPPFRIHKHIHEKCIKIHPAETKDETNQRFLKDPSVRMPSEKDFEGKKNETCLSSKYK